MENIKKLNESQFIMTVNLYFDLYLNWKNNWEVFMFNKETYFKFCEDFHPFSLETNNTANMIEVKHHKPYFY